MTGNLEKARMFRVNGPLDNPELDRDSEIKVQFNPTTLKVGLANSLKQNERDQSSRAAQFIEKSSSNLTVELIFDTSASYVAEDGQDLKGTNVRLIVRRIAHTFLYSPDAGNERVEPQRCLFIWGAFAFVGIMESLEETLDFFSPEGVPLRATVAIKLTESRFIYLNAPAREAQQDTPTLSNAPATVDDAHNEAASGGSGAGEESPDPRSTAMYNGVESPRSPGGGALSVPSASATASIKASASIGGGLGAGASISGGFGAGLGAGFGAGAGFGIGVSASFGIGVGVSASAGLGAGASAGAGFGIGASAGASVGGGGNLSAGVSGKVSASLSGLSGGAALTPPAFSFGASNSLGTSIPGAFSADFKASSGLSAGALVRGAVSLREEDLNPASASHTAATSVHATTAGAAISAHAQVGFD